MTELDGKSFDIVEENIARLKQIFPEAFTEDKIDFDKLQALLGNYINEDEDNYNFAWHGKLKALRTAQNQSTGTLRPPKKKSSDWDTTGNVFIEGDNLEVLKLLQKSYQRKIKMIYIDPPYNTGNEFIYPDDYKDNLETYLRYTGQLDDEGYKVSTNFNKAGRFHTNWLNMMYPRLKLARNLLSEDGVIFISIDEHEQVNLQKLCNEIFGEENFVGVIIRKTKSTTNDASNGFNTQHESCLVYIKNADEFVIAGEKKDFSNYKNLDNDPNGEWVSGDPTARTGYVFSIINPYTGKVDESPVGACWRFSEEKYKEHVKSGRIKFKKSHKENERGFIFKRYLSEVKSDLNLVNSLFAADNPYMNQVGTKEMNKLFDDGIVEYPKPSIFIKKLVQYATQQDSIILDFFAGSCTTADAVMQMNAEDGGNRKYICVQLPEPCKEDSNAYQAGYSTIAEVGKQRIGLAAQKIKNKNSDYNGDFGFKDFKLDSSNLIRWDASFETLKKDLENAREHIKSDRSSEDILYEVILKCGYSLTDPIEKLKIDGKTIYSVADGELVCCFDEDLSLELAEGIGEIKKLRNIESMQIVLLDDGFSDNITKTNIMHILNRFGIPHANIASI